MSIPTKQETTTAKAVTNLVLIVNYFDCCKARSFSTGKWDWNSWFLYEMLSKQLPSAEQVFGDLSILADWKLQSKKLIHINYGMLRFHPDIEKRI